MSSKKRLKDPNTLRIFFSSPFGGMEEEREELTRKYFPQFHHVCNAKGVQFVAVDMRWGITSEAADNAQVISICLKELDRSDVFIGFFGQRYGWHGHSDELLQKNFDNAVGHYLWLNNVRDRSVTELEFLHGHLNNPGALPACICFRDKAYDDSIREDAVTRGDKKNIFKYSAESEHSSKMMSDLIRRVKETEDKTLGINTKYKDPHEGAKFIFESVFPTCLELLEGRDIQELSPLEQERIFHDAKMASLCSVFIRGEEYLKMINLEKLVGNPRYLIHGPQGIGKSAVLANFVKKLKEENPELNVIYHFVGSGPGTTDPLKILERILSELQNITTDDLEKGDDFSEANKLKEEENEKFHGVYMKVLQQMENLVSQGKRLVLVIDSLNKVKSGEKTAKHLFWLPEKYPDGVAIVVSTVASDTASYDLLVSKQNYTSFEIQPLSQKAQKWICEKSLIKSGKEFSPVQLQRVVDAEQTKNPLFLKIFLNEVSIYGHFFSLDEKIDSLIYSNGIRELLNKVLKRMEDDYNVKEFSGLLVNQVLSAIALSHRGLYEKEIQEMFNIPSHVWSPFYFALENFLISHGGLLRFSFTEIFEAVKERYLKTEEERNQAMKSLAEYFSDFLQKSNTIDYLEDIKMKRVASELPWLQKRMGDKTSLMKTIGDVRIFYPLMCQSISETIDLWRESGASDVELCSNLLRSFDEAISNVYLSHQENGDIDAKPPGYLLLSILKSMKEFFNEIYRHECCITVLKRTISILEGIEGYNIPENVRTTVLRDQSYFLATTYIENTQYKEARVLLESVIKECKSHLEIHDDERVKQTLAYCFSGVGTLHLKQGLYSQAEEYLQQSADIHKELGNERCVIDSLQNIALVKMNVKEEMLAMEYFNKVMEFYEHDNFGHLTLTQGNLLTNMAVTQRRLGNLDEAEQLYFRSMKVKAQVVGWDHEVVATTYMNLGTLELHRENYLKAEEYSRKAIEIHEGNKVKLEQNEMWQSLENFANTLVLQEKFEEALPIFQRVYAMLKREEKIYQGFTYLHKQMMSYMLNKGMFEELIDVLEGYTSSPNLREANLFKVLDHCYQMLPPELKQKQPEEHKVEYALREFWPGNNELTAYMARTYVLPQNDIEKLLELLDIMDKMNPDFLSSTYLVGTIWCEDVNNWQALVQVAQAGLEKYPEALDLKTKCFDGLRQLKQYHKAYPLIKDILQDQKDNQALMLVCGQVALMSDDLTLCKELWEKVSCMPNEDLADKAKSGLLQIAELMNQEENNVP